VRLGGSRVQVNDGYSPSQEFTGRTIAAIQSATLGRNAVVILSRSGATTGTSPATATPQRPGGIPAVIDKLFQSDAFADPSPVYRPRRNRPPGPA
jgi:hypothetical protein